MCEFCNSSPQVYGDDVFVSDIQHGWQRIFVVTVDSAHLELNVSGGKSSRFTSNFRLTHERLSTI